MSKSNGSRAWCVRRSWRFSTVPTVFVTSTGTDIGKTFVAAGLIRLLRDQGMTVGALKPIVSGYDSSVVETSDPAVLLAALGRPVSANEIAGIAPWRFRAPLAPDLAAAREGRTLDFDAVLEFSRRAGGNGSGLLLIEGVGGIMAPIDTRHTVLDWMTALRAPVLLVVGSYLGSISHTLTAVHVLAEQKLGMAAIVVSESDRSPVPMEDTVASIARFAGATPVIGLPRLPSGVRHHPAFGDIARLL
jgi:dethiobiotin synthetase